MANLMPATRKTNPELVDILGDAPVLLEDPIDDALPEEKILIHIVADGFTALGQVWYVGQEIEFDPKGGAYLDTRGRDGRSWLDLRFDENAQYERFGQVMFRNGPWTGKSYAAAKGVQLQHQLTDQSTGRRIEAPDETALTAAERAEAARNRAAPRLPSRA